MTVAAARSEDASKVYGYGEMAVTALDNISVSFETNKFSAIMGPSGSGKSTLMHCMAGLDNLTSGNVFIGGVDLSTLDDKALTHLRRDQVGFIFQAFNLVPTLTARENITLPLDLAGREPGRRLGFNRHRDNRNCRPANPPSQRALGWSATAGCGGTGPGESPRDHLRRRAERQPRLEIRRRAPQLSPTCGFLQRAVREFDQTIVMVTHDPVAASYADRIVFLADGNLVDEMTDPTPDAVFDKIKSLEG